MHEIEDFEKVNLKLIKQKKELLNSGLFSNFLPCGFSKKKRYMMRYSYNFKGFRVVDSTASRMIKLRENNDFRWGQSKKSVFRKAQI